MPHVEGGGLPESATAFSPVMESINYIPNIEQSVTSSYPIAPSIETTQTEILSFDQFTLCHVPSPDERKAILSGLGISDFVIRHEVGHALAGRAKRKPIVELNFNPGPGGSVAYVLFDSKVDPVTAAAGAALAGSEYGTAGDKMTVAYWGGNWDSSVSGAHTLIYNNYDAIVTERVIDLTKYMAHVSGGVIPGGVFDQIIQRAREELAHEEKNNDNPNPYASLQFDKDKIDESREKWMREMEAKSSNLLPERYTKEILYENGNVIIEYWVSGKLKKTEEICSICGHLNGHSIEIHQWYAMLHHYAQTSTEESYIPTGIDLIYRYRQPTLVEPKEEPVET